MSKLLQNLVSDKKMTFETLKEAKRTFEEYTFTKLKRSRPFLDDGELFTMAKYLIMRCVEENLCTTSKILNLNSRKTKFNFTKKSHEEHTQHRLEKYQSIVSDDELSNYARSLLKECLNIDPIYISSYNIGSFTDIEKEIEPVSQSDAYLSSGYHTEEESDTSSEKSTVKVKFPTKSRKPVLVQWKLLKKYLKLKNSSVRTAKKIEDALFLSQHIKNELDVLCRDTNGIIEKYLNVNYYQICY